VKGRRGLISAAIGFMSVSRVTMLHARCEADSRRPCGLKARCSVVGGRAEARAHDRCVGGCSL